jgi:hypothetical protein
MKALEDLSGRAGFLILDGFHPDERLLVNHQAKRCHFF